MWIIIERLINRPEHCWFAGVFLNYDDMQNYLSILPNRPTEIREVREIPTHEYPVLFVYDFNANDLLYVTNEQLVDKLSKIKLVDDDDHEYCKYYVFNQDYRGFSPQEEYYTWTNHHHIDNHALKSLIAKGLLISCIGTFEGIYCCENCHRAETGILSEKGYTPPSQWQIIPQIYLEASTKYITICSEECKLILMDELSSD